MDTILKSRETYNHAPSGEAPGDLDQISENVEALLARLNKVGNALTYLYGQGESGAQSAKPRPAGKIPQIQALISDLSDEVDGIEQILKRL